MYEFVNSAKPENIVKAHQAVEFLTKVLKVLWLCFVLKCRNSAL